jgi:hypothetical protein
MTSLTKPVSMLASCLVAASLAACSTTPVQVTEAVSSPAILDSPTNPRATPTTQSTPTVPPYPTTSPTPQGVLPPGLIYELDGSLWHVGETGPPTKLITAHPDSRFRLSIDASRAFIYELDPSHYIPKKQVLLDLATQESMDIWPVPDGPSCPFRFLDETPLYLGLTLLPEGADPGYNCELGSPAFLPADGGPLLVLDPTRNSEGNWDVSPDGDKIAFDVDGAPWIYSFSDGPHRFFPESYGFRPFAVYRFFSPSWSPDGRSLAWAFSSEDWTHQGVVIFNLANVTHRTIEPLQVNRYEVCQADINWSQDANFISVSHCEYLYSLLADPEGHIVYRQDTYSWVNWAPVGHSFVMSNFGSKPFATSSLTFVDRPGGTPRPIGDASFLQWLDSAQILVRRDDAYYIVRLGTMEETRLSLPEGAIPQYVPALGSQ